MKLNHLITNIIFAVVMAFIMSPSKLHAQLPDPNTAGISTGHIHLLVTDVTRHTEIWTSLGANLKQAGRLQLLTFPRMIILLTERAPTGPSSDTVVNHIAFLIRDYASYRTRLADAGATFVMENAEDGQLIADLPDGARVEFLQSDEISHPIEFHHVHLVAADQEALRDWYVNTFGAEAASRRNMPSALVPGGRVDVMGTRGDAVPIPTRGSAIDHIGFEVADLHAFIERLNAQGVKLDLGPIEAPAIGLKVAFITDPAGTYIELTEGLDNLD